LYFNHINKQKNTVLYQTTIAVMKLSQKVKNAKILT